ncbi:cytochrome P450, partial [Nocardia gipuzkoensis]
MTISLSATESDIELFSAAALLDPYPHYRTLRELGPVVHLSAYDMYGLFRYDQVRPALIDWESFSSAPGIAMNAACNEASEGSLLSMDPPRHRAVRKVLDDALRPRYIRRIAGDIEQHARDLVENLSARAEFDGVADFACKLPVEIVMDLIGFPRDEHRA